MIGCIFVGVGSPSQWSGAYEKPLLSLDKAGYEIPYFWGSGYVSEVVNAATFSGYEAAVAAWDAVKQWKWWRGKKNDAFRWPATWMSQEVSKWLANGL